MLNLVRRVEEISLNALPAFNTTCYDGWLLRSAEGFTNRANSVNMLYTGELPIDKKIAYCERFYARLSLPTVFKVTPLSMEIDAALDKCDYSRVTPTTVMTAELTKTSAKNLLSNVEVGISARWQDSYFRISGLRETAIPLAKKVYGSILEKCLCATITVSGEIVACGLCVVEGAYAGLFDISVSPEHRRCGYGQDICVSLTNAALDCGAKTAYLQVVSDNVGAVWLYEKLGFKDTYKYWYRVKM